MVFLFVSGLGWVLTVRLNNRTRVRSAREAVVLCVLANVGYEPTCDVLLGDQHGNALLVKVEHR